MAEGYDVAVEQVGRPSRRALLVSVALFVAMTVVGLLWAKWWPYAGKVGGLVHSAVWPGNSILDAAGDAGSAPSWRGAWTFTVSYGVAVWKALVVALLVAAAVESLVPRSWLLRVLGRGRERYRGTLVGGLLALPCMMCTCCTAPVVVSLRRGGVPTSSALAYWVGNPTLNPAVLAFLILVAPWQWALTRVLVGIVLVFGVTALVSRLAPGASVDPAEGRSEAVPDRRPTPYRFLRALLRLSVTLVPEYLIVVLALGAFRGWLFPLDGSAVSWGIAAVLVAAILGTLVVIPTAGEIPIVQGLAAAGVGAGVLGALLICLPALSLVSIVMVGRALSWRVTAAMAAGVVLCAMFAGALLQFLS